MEVGVEEAEGLGADADAEAELKPKPLGLSAWVDRMTLEQTVANRTMDASESDTADWTFIFVFGS